MELVKPENQLGTVLLTVPTVVMVFVRPHVEKTSSLVKQIVELVVTIFVKLTSKIRSFVPKIVVLVEITFVM